MFEAEDILPFCSCIMLAIVGLAIYASISFYEYWKDQKGNFPLPSAKEKAQFIMGLFLTAIVLIYDIVAIFLVGSFIWFFFLTD